MEGLVLERIQYKIEKFQTPAPTFPILLGLNFKADCPMSSVGYTSYKRIYLSAIYQYTNAERVKQKSCYHQDLCSLLLLLWPLLPPLHRHQHQASLLNVFAHGWSSSLLINLFCRSSKDVTQRRINDHPEYHQPASSCSSWKSATALNGSSSSAITSLTNCSVSSSQRTRSSPRSRIPVPVPRCCHPLPSRCWFFL